MWSHLPDRANSVLSAIFRIEDLVEAYTKSGKAPCVNLLVLHYRSRANNIDARFDKKET